MKWATSIATCSKRSSTKFQKMSALKLWNRGTTFIYKNSKFWPKLPTVSLSCATGSGMSPLWFMSVVRTVLIKFSKLWFEPEWLEQLRHTVPFKTCSFSSVSSVVFAISALRESKDDDLASPHEAEASIGQTKAKTMRPMDFMPKMAMLERSKVRSKIDRDRGKMRSLLQAKHFSHAVRSGFWPWKKGWFSPEHCSNKRCWGMRGEIASQSFIPPAVSTGELLFAWYDCETNLQSICCKHLLGEANGVAISSKWCGLVPETWCQRQTWGSS